MKSPILGCVLCTLFLFLVSPEVDAQFAEIQPLPDQADRESIYTNGGAVVEAANGDALVFVVENGEITDGSQFPLEGTPAHLILYSTSDGGDTWAARDTLRAGIETFGSQGIGRPQAVVLESGRIVLIFWYQLDAFPNYAARTEVYTSDDHGSTWDMLGARERETAALDVTPSGMLVSVDWVDDGFGNLEFRTSTSANDGMTWMDGPFVADSDEICGTEIHAITDTQWAFVYADCFLGMGGTNHVYARITSDSGATWSDPDELATAGSAFGTLGSLVLQSEESLYLVYSNEFEITYRMGAFEDVAFSFSESMGWTVGTSESGDLPPTCASGSAGPICMFERTVDGRMAKAWHVGIVGVSADPLAGSVASEHAASLPESIALSWNYPNPFSAGTTIEFELERSHMVSLRVYDMLGREVAALVDGPAEAERHRVTWSADGLPGGMYFYRLMAGADVTTGAMTLVR